MAITLFKVIQGHRFWYQSKAHRLPKLSDNVRVWAREQKCLKALSEDCEWRCSCDVSQQVVSYCGAGSCECATANRHEPMKIRLNFPEQETHHGWDLANVNFTTTSYTHYTNGNKTNPNPHLVAMRYGNVVLPYILRSAVLVVVVVVVVVALSWVKAEPLYPHHNYILG